MGIPALTDHLQDRNNLAGEKILIGGPHPGSPLKIEILVNPEAHIGGVQGE